MKQKKWVAVERAMGAGKGQCRVSIIGGLAVFILLATILGSFLGNSLMNAMLQRENREETETYFSKKYSISQDIVEVQEEDVEKYTGEIRTVMFAVPPILTLFVVAISICIINRQFQSEIMMSLGDREN